MPIIPTWSRPDAALTLTRNEIHIWRAPLDQEQVVLDYWLTKLEPGERARADRFVHSRDRNGFVARRAILRTILSLYMHCPPAEIKLSYGAQGKPALHPDSAALPIRFNLSHSRDLAVFAFSWGRDVGIDLEAIRPDFETEEIASRSFSARELDQLRSVAPDQRVERFFVCWTRKEAYVKALGSGLNLSLDTFTVSVNSYLFHETFSIDGGSWKLCSFLPKPGYAAAIMAQGEDWNLRFWEMTGDLPFKGHQL
jgi:4'-phosphopantetheinyl transferase